MTSISKKKIALIEKYNQEKLRNQAMKLGVTLKSPETVFLSNDTKYGKNVIINPYVVIGKKTKIGSNVEILSFTHIENATLEDKVNVGPFSRIRPGTFLSKGSRVGNFVEIKKSKVGKNTKINHLSYVGDAIVG
ncbi:bifunctional N-acetylglucosamine-1-phosphate uridyltransferase/glucosamine-1-phosphate acetyltransferase, partial [Pelagibacteraceae bacterium]|nr:bifunctional N-acetylglucosamine-1-phosphate uridyltransferase/glucosamine-1-phosphate acetyltransferase [Pelagibacteraceae bacterium]